MIIENTTIVFHYNKKHNEDFRIPPWILKAKGQTFYVNHFDVEPGIGFSTKETPENPHTKAALKFKGNLEILEKDGFVNGRIFGTIAQLAEQH